LIIGPLATFAGDYLSKYIPVMCQLMGSTECGFIPVLAKRPEFWQSFQWHPTAGGLAMEQVGDDPDVCELVINRSPDQEWCQGAFETFPELTQWRTKDLYRKNGGEGVSQLWLYEGRTDDVIVLSNGEKFNPVGMEIMVQGHPKLKGALVVGQARFQCGMILEPKENGESGLVDEIWPLIEKANKMAPAHAQVSKELVMVASPEKPFARAGKGTVQRWKTVHTYSAEIDALYEAFDASNPAADGEVPPLASATDGAIIQEYVHNIVSGILHGRKVEAEDDLFVLGVDSLQTSQLANTIRNALVPHFPSAKNISTRFVYENPSVAKLTTSILRLATGQTSAAQETSIEERMKAMVEKYTSDLPAKVSALHKENSSSKINVALTGSTGSLGFYIILALLANPQIGTIYCLDRADDASSRFSARWAELGEESLTPEAGKMVFHQVTFGAERFGLADEVYNRLSNDIHVIVHNAWKVNFNHPLESFETQIRGVQEFAKWSLQSALHPAVFFVSSISSAGSCSTAVPEHILHDYSVPSPMGYGHSKYVSERILDTVASKFQVPMHVFRVGQVAGPVLRGNKGEWNRQEWFPSLVKSSGGLGVVPSTIGGMDGVDWIPVDILGRIITELISAPKPSASKFAKGARVFNLVNPTPAKFADLIPAIKAYFLEKYAKDIDNTAFKEWLELLKSKDASDPKVLEELPALKIVDFFESIKGEGGMGGGFETTGSQEVSASMRDLRPVTGDWMNVWLAQWQY
jgi:thioester reductase-like protein